MKYVTSGIICSLLLSGCGGSSDGAAIAGLLQTAASEASSANSSLAENREYVEFALSGTVIDAEYDSARDIVVVLAGNQLLLVDGLTGVETPVPLPEPGVALSLSPDGNFAAVSHTNSISRVDLRAEATIDTVAVGAEEEMGDVVMGPEGLRAFGFPATGQWTNVTTLNFATGTFTEGQGGTSVREGTLAKLHPDGKRLYGANNGLSPSDIERYDLSSNTITLAYDSPYHGDYDFDGDLWFSADGADLLSKAGVVTQLADQRSQDMNYLLTLGDGDLQIASADMNESGREWLVLDQSDSNPLSGEQVEVYDADSGVLTASYTLPVLGELALESWKGAFVFAKERTDAHVVVAHDNIEDPTLARLFLLNPTVELAVGSVPKAEVEKFTSLRAGQSANLDGTLSSDPEDAALTYRWTVLSEPAGSSMADNSGAIFDFRSSVAGNYEIGLTVNNGANDSQMAVANVNVFSDDSSIIHRLDDVVHKAEYSATLHALVYISGRDQALKLVSLNTMATQVLPLSAVGYDLALSPGESFAAISHLNSVTLVDLQDMTIVDEQMVETESPAIVLDRSLRAHVIVGNNMVTIDFANNTAVVGDRVTLNAATLDINPRQDWIYAASNGVSPTDFGKITISGSSAVFVGDSPYHGDYDIDGELWLSEDGEQLMVAGGHTFYSSDSPNLDMIYRASLPDDIDIRSAAHSVERGEWAVLTEDRRDNDFISRVQLHGDNSLGRRLSNTAIGNIPVAGGSDLVGEGVEVFYNFQGTQLIVLSEGKNARDRYAVEVIDLSF